MDRRNDTRLWEILPCPKLRFWGGKNTSAVTIDDDYYSWNYIFTGRNEVVAKVMFLHVSVILSTGGVSGQHPPPDQADTPQQREPPPGPGRPPSRENPPGRGRHPPAGRTPQDQADPPLGRRLQHTVNERPVRILLECILVLGDKHVRSRDVVHDFFWFGNGKKGLVYKCSL